MPSPLTTGGSKTMPAVNTFAVSAERFGLPPEQHAS